MSERPRLKKVVEGVERQSLRRWSEHVARLEVMHDAMRECNEPEFASTLDFALLLMKAIRPDV